MTWTGNYAARCNNHHEAVVVDSLRQHLTDGEVYTISDTSFNLAVDGSMNFGFYGYGNGTDYKYWIHFRLQTDQSVNIRTIEDASWNTPLVAAYIIQPKNMNRDSTNTCQCRVFANPRMSGKWGQGTVVKEKYVMAMTEYAGSTVKAISYTTEDTTYDPILPSNRYYVVNVVNKSPFPANVCAEAYIIELEK